tara:strand:- start:1560 stop:2210 length:651 start_codon:yes stop_codon:yes gene_type:complete
MIKANLKKRIYTSFGLLFFAFLIAGFSTILIFGLIILSVLSILEFLNLTNRITKKIFTLFALNSFFILYISTFSILFFYFSNFLQLKIILFSLLLTCVASDIGGFIFGKLFKGPKLTKISPNKTFSGAAGSLIFSVIIFSSSIFYFTGNFNLNIFSIAIITSLTCQLGDLLFSFVKRKAKVKDTGNFLPGHGGVLDRLDGILVGLPAGFLSLTFIY